MKKTACILCVIAFVFAMFSGTALAATVYTPDSNGLYTVSGTVSAYANKQVTLIVHSGSSATAATIQYIDQQKADASGKYTFVFKPKDIPSTLQVKLGGEARTAPQLLGTIEKTGAPTTVTLSGKVIFYGPENTLAFTVKNKATNLVTTINPNETGNYSVTLNSGDYELLASKPYHTSYKKNNLSLTADTTYNFTLPAGLIAPSATTIDIQSIIVLIGNYSKTGVPGFIPSDINWDGRVDIYDVIILIQNYSQTDIVVA